MHDRRHLLFPGIQVGLDEVRKLLSRTFDPKRGMNDDICTIAESGQLNRIIIQHEHIVPKNPTVGPGYVIIDEAGWLAKPCQKILEEGSRAELAL